MPVEVRLLGTPRVRAGGSWMPVPRDKRGALLVYLAHEADWVSRERLGFLFWPDVPDAAARRNLRQLLTRLKSLSPPFAPEIDAEHLRWRVTTDVAWFRQALEAGDAERAVALATAAFCDGFSVADASGWHGWLEQARDDLDEAWRDAALSLVAEHGRKGRHADAAALAKRVWDRRPLDDEALNAYLAAAHAAGQRDAALAAFADFERSLDHELGLLPLAETLALVDAIRSEAPRAAPAAPGRMVAPRGGTRFVGRDRELTELEGWLEAPDCRLVVVVGMGGVGKTRLARELARRRTDAYRDGATFVALGGSESRGAMAWAIADATGLKLAPGRDAAAQLGDHFRTRRALLVVDDLERHDRDAEVLVDLLEQAPNLRIVVTSREELDVPQAWTFRLEGLRYPKDQEAAAGADPFDASEAAQVFLQAAARGNRRLRIDDDERVAVLEVCRLTEGLPLALELAGAWAKHLSVREIADELRRDVSALMRSPDARDAAGMRAVFERSWRLLSLEQQRTLAWLTVFRGGFDRRAAEQVTGASLYLLLGLVSKSLVAKEASGRFGVHQIVREYAAEKLAENPDELAAAERRHSAYYLGLLEAMAPGQHVAPEHVAPKHVAPQHVASKDVAPQGAAPKDQAPKDQVPKDLAPTDLTPKNQAADAGNLLRAWRTLCENGDQDGLARGLPGLVRFLDGRSAFEEGVASLTSAREAATGALAAELDAHRGAFLLRLGRPGEAKELLLAALRGARAADDDCAVALVLLRLGSAHDALGEYQAAEQVLREALAMAERRNDPERRMAAASALGLVAMHRSDLVKATERFQEALALARSLDHDTATAHGLNNLALALQRRGDYAAALPLVEESLAIGRAAEDPYAVAEGLTSLGILSYVLEDHARAKDAFEESLRTYQRIGNRAKIAGAYNNLSGVLHALGDLAEAIPMAERSLEAREAIGDRKGALLCLHNLGNFHQASGNHVEAMARFRQALEGARSLGHVREQVATLSSMASCALEQGQHGEGWGRLQEALTLAQDIEANDVLLDALANVARAMAHDDAERAIAIATTVHRHPSCLPSTKQNVAALAAELATAVSADGVRRATERAGATSLHQVVAAVLSHGATVDEPGSA